MLRCRATARPPALSHWRADPLPGPRYARQVLHSGCCSRPGACASLRNGLMGAADGTGGDQAGSSGPYEGAPDLCNMGRNLCDVDGRLVHLALVNEVRV